MKRRTRPAVLRTAPCHWGKMFLKEAKIVLKEKEETTARFQAKGGLSRPRGCSESPCGAGAVPKLPKPYKFPTFPKITKLLKPPKPCRLSKLPKT